MPKLADAALDAAVGYVITNGTQLALCSSEPSVYGDLATLAIANDSTVTCGAAGDGTPSGRKTTVPASACVGSADGTAGYWALHDGSSILVAAGALAAPISVNTGITYTTAAFDITVKDAISV